MATPSHPASAWLEERDLDDEELCCLRRTITAEGRSRAWVNNKPVTLKDLRDTGLTVKNALLHLQNMLEER